MAKGSLHRRKVIERTERSASIMKQPLVISVSQIEEVLRTSLSPALQEQCLKADLRYEELADEEPDSYILEVVEVLIRRIFPSWSKRRCSSVF
jgi:hypothetical protein